MNKYIIYALLMSLLFSCSISKPIQKAVDIAFTSTIITQMVMTKALIETTEAIFHEDSLNQDMPIYVHSLKGFFVSKLDTFELTIDSVKVVWTNDTTVTFSKIVIFEDSIIYKQVPIPSYMAYLGNDTLNVRVVCEYLPSMEIINGKNKFKCLAADYIVEKQCITIKNKFENCDVNRLK